MSRVVAINGNRPQVLELGKEVIVPRTGIKIDPDGRTGAEYIEALKSKELVLSDGAVAILRHPRFMPMIGVGYRCAIIGGSELKDCRRTTAIIREEGRRRGYMTPPIALAPLLRELLSDAQMENMGFTWLVVMHDPVEGSSGLHSLLTLHQWYEAFPYHLHAHFSTLNRSWGHGYGFVFVQRFAMP